jgi:polyhydroxyalkanoate synthesis repressor PhaR
LILIKRYRNRKLYDTEVKQYVSLDIIAGRIREGDDVQVVDNVTGDDVTVLILAQIIADQERRQGGDLLAHWRVGEHLLQALRGRFNLPSRLEVEALADQVEALTKLVDDLSRQVPPKT